MAPGTAKSKTLFETPVLNPWGISLVLVAFGITLASALQCWFQSDPLFAERHAQTHHIQSVAGELRTFVAEYFYDKADAYFLSGWAPSIHDESSPSTHRRPDCLERFGANFRPAHHDQEGGEKGNPEEAREVLPWLGLAVEVDPHHIPSYLNAVFILRKYLQHPHEAESLLRAGIIANPREASLRFELGHMFYSELNDFAKAEAIWECTLELVEHSPITERPANRDLRRKLRLYLHALKEQIAEQELPPEDRTFQPWRFKSHPAPGR